MYQNGGNGGPLPQTVRPTKSLMFQKLLQNENKQFPPKLRLDALPFTIHIALSKTIKVHPYKSSIIYYLNPRNELKDLDGFK